MPDAANAILSGFGLDPALQLLRRMGNVIMPIEIPSPGELLDFVNRGLVDEEDAAQMLRIQGCNYATAKLTRNDILGSKMMQAFNVSWHAAKHAAVERPAVGELLDMLNRGWIDDKVCDEQLHLRGYAYQSWRELMMRLREEMPTVSDLVQFSVKDVWIPEVVQRYKYDAEIPDQYKYWMGKIGAAWNFTTPNDQGDWSLNLTPAEAHWRSHWDLMSPSQAYESFWRLRPDRVQRYQRIFAQAISDMQEADPTRSVKYAQVFKSIPPFDIEDLALHLRVANFAPLSRPWLAAIAYRPLTRVDIRRMYASGVIDRGEVAASYQDIGYDSERAEQLTVFTETITRKSAISPDVRMHQRTIVESYVLRLIDRPTATAQLLATMGHDVQPGQNGQQLSQSQIVAQQKAQAEVDARLSSADAAESLRRSKRIIAVMRRRYLRGHVDDTDVRGELGTVGFPAAAIDQLLAEWSHELDGPRREFTTDQILKLFKKGIIGVEEGQNRLINLGWSIQESAYLLELQGAQPGAFVGEQA